MADMPRDPTEAADGGSLAAFLRERREDVLTAWEQAVQVLPCARMLTRPELRDSLPTVLDEIAVYLDRPADAGEGEPSPPLADEHALERLREGFDITEVVEELALLRDATLRLWQPSTATELEQVRDFDRALDGCMVATARRFGESQARTMRVLERISTVALRAESIEDVLDALLAAFQEESPAVDTAAIYLLEDDRLQLRAAAGVEADVKGYSLGVAEGFAGRVAAERRPLETSSAAADPSLASDLIRRANILTLHGVPLIDGERLIGVACMGSKTAFSGQDRTLFTSMTSRAAAGIRHHMLRRRARAKAAELEISEKRFRDTFESAAVGLGHIAVDGRWLRMNDHYCVLLGYPRDELLRLTLRDVTHPDDVASDDANIARLTARDIDVYATEKRCIRKDGGVVWVDQTLSLVRDRDAPAYLVAAAQDVSLRVRQRQQRTFLADASTTLASTLDYRETLDNLTKLAVPRIADLCVVQLVDSSGDILRTEAIAHADDGAAIDAAMVDAATNEAPTLDAAADAAPAMNALRRPYPIRDDLPGPLGTVLRSARPALLPIDDAALRSIAVDEQHLAELRRLELGSILILPLRIGGRTMGALSLGQSGSGRRFEPQDVELLQELGTIASAAIDNALLHAEIQRAVRVRDRVLGIVTHDLRNPIGTIDLSATLLTMSRAVASDPAAAAQIATIQRNVRRATRLIEDLLDMSSVKAGQFAIDRKRESVAAIVQEAADSHRPVADEKRIDFYVDVAVGDAAILGDHDRLLQVLNNVIGNALKFCRAGDRVTVRSSVEDDTIAIVVADTGPGIAPERLEQIFDPYVRVQQDEEGTGLGLYIARAIVGAHGGRIWAESEPGAGTTMHICLPSAPKEA